MNVALKPSRGVAQRVGGRYLIEHMLGEGGMGAVYQVLDQSTGKQLALKVLTGPRNARQSALFEREFQTLANLRHPRIVQVFEYGVDQGTPFYTMELLEGKDLSSRSPMGWRDVCACLRDVASILGMLHSRRLVHRDLSPRNLWQLPDGRLKLLDFGALAPFGTASEIVGTPAFVAPESIQNKPLDQRTDLFALGALGYWLLTSAHAFRATRLSELTTVWKKAPAAPSSLAKLVQGADRDIPVELDRLIDALLRLDPDERPRNTAEVIDRLNAIAGLVPEAEDVIFQGYLESKLFVGRARELHRFSKNLSEAELGTPGSLCVEGPSGIGRSHLLNELSMTARLLGASVISVVAGAGGRPYETAISLARELLLALPNEALKAATSQASVLAGLSPLLAASLGEPARATAAENAIEERSRRQTALAGWFLTLSEQRTLVLVVDDLHAADEESQALLAALARADAGHRLLLVGSVCSDSPLAEQNAVRSFSTNARKLRLSPLEVTEIRDLLRSLFGEVPYLERLAVRLHRISDGSPSHTLMLARYLVASGVARYAEGAWTLPTELPNDLPSTLKAVVLASLEELKPEARSLARLASVPEHGTLTRPMLAVLAQAAPQALEETLRILLQHRVLRESEDGLQVAHPALREALLSELSADDRARTRRTLVGLFARQADLLSQVRAGLLALQAGDLPEGERRLLDCSRRIMAGELDSLRTAAPLFAEALALLRASGRDAYAKIPLLNVLSVAGYQVDRSYAVDYGDEAISALQGVLHFDVARRLRPFLGGLLSLLVALGLSAFAMRRRKSGLRPIESITWLFTVLGYLMGPAAMCLDRRRLRGYAKVFEPMLALGANHGVSVVHRFCEGLALGLEDRIARAQQLLSGVIDRLNDPRPIRSLPEGNRRNLLGAACYAYGTRQTFACDPQVLTTASALERGNPVHVLQAEQLRALYFSYRGEVARAAECDHRVELKAIQLGTAWQAELVAPRHLARVALWTHDLAMHKRAARALTRLAQDIPSFGVSAQRAQGTDLVLRGKYEAALPLLELEEEPLSELGWASARAALAAAYNGLARHHDAKAVCTDVLTHLSTDDRAFVVQYLPAEIELCIAEAGLGNFVKARQDLAGLVRAHTDKGPLVLGQLERARVRVALSERDFVAAEHYLDAMDACYKPTRIPSLLILCVELRQELRRQREPISALETPLTADDAHLLTRVELIMTSGVGDVEDRAARSALQVALELTGADRGSILYAQAEKPAAWLGNAPGAELLDWARARLSAAAEEDGQTAVLWAEGPPPEADVRSFDAVPHSLSLLWGLEGDTAGPLAALVLGSPAGAPEPPPSAVLRVLGERLSRLRDGVVSASSAMA